MNPVGSVVDRLETEITNVWIAPALAFKLPLSYPSIYVFLISEKAEPNKTFGGHRQRNTQIIGTELMVKHIEGALHTSPYDEIDDLRESVMIALKGWKINTDYTAFDFVRGDLVSYENGFVIWRDQYSTSYSL